MGLGPRHPGDQVNLELTEDQQILKEAMREFADGEIAPGAAERDEQARFPSELIPKLAEQGLLGIMIPEEYGGAGYDAVSAAIIIEEIARVDAAVALLVGSHNSLCSGHILLAGSDDQKRQVSAAARARREARRLGAHRAGIGLRRRCHAHARDARRGLAG